MGMQISDILASAQGGSAVANLAKAFGITTAEAQAALDAVVTRLGDRIERNTLNRGGTADLVSLMGNPAFGKVLDEPDALASPETQALGIDVLDEVLWSKDGSRAVAARAARQSGVSESLIRSMLPTIAAMVVAGLAKGGGGAIGDILAKIGTASDAGPDPDREAPSRPVAEGKAPSRPKSPAGGGSVGHQVPLPVPGEIAPSARRGTGPGLDDLSDIIRRGGHQIPRGSSGTGGVDGGALGNIVRSILGSLLGFENKGFVSWLIRLIVLKWGAAILQRILRRILGG